MKKILNRRQIQSILLLTAVIFILLCGVAYTVSARRTEAVVQTPAGVEKPPHELLRAARASANDRIEWETNIGGTGDETPVTVLQKNNELYVFGNTNSHDLDFTGLAEHKTRGFCARLSLLGRTLAFTVFDFTVAKAVPTAGGFAVAGNEGSVAGLYLLTDDLTVSGKATMPPAHALTAVGLYIFDNRYFLFASARDEATDKTTLLLHIYTVGLACEREKTFVHSYGLELLEVLPTANGGYLLAAAAKYQTTEHLTIARFSSLGEPAYTDIDLGYSYTPTAFLPLGDGYAAACDAGGKCHLLLLSNDLVHKSTQVLCPTANANRKTAFYAGGTYAYTGEQLVALSDEGRNMGAIDFAPQAVTAFCYNGVAAFVAGNTQNGIAVAMIGKQKTEVLQLQTANTQTALLCAGANSLILCADNAAKTADCADWFGGADVWLSKIPLTGIA